MAEGCHPAKKDHNTRTQKRDEIFFLLGSQFQFEYEVEKLYRVFQCQQPAVVKVRW
jgi:hypothetical protein